jgi:hypothetical protein
MAVILSCKENSQAYAKPFFSLAAYRNTYIHSIMHPEHQDLSGSPQFVKENVQLFPSSQASNASDTESDTPLLPPKTRRAPGQPKKRRIRSQSEVGDDSEPKKKRQVQKCQKCRQSGHLRQTCSAVIG